MLTSSEGRRGSYRQLRRTQPSFPVGEYSLCVGSQYRKLSRNQRLMNAQRIKTHLISIIGAQATARVQALRFAYLLKTKKRVPDPEVQLLGGFIGRGDVAVDIGANGADWTYHIYGFTGASGRIFAFEADPYYALATDLAIGILRLKGVQLFSFGLSSVDEEVPLRVGDSSGLRFAGLGYVDKSVSCSDKSVVAVPMKRLDSMLSEYPELWATKLIKCDVEGYELFVMQGASKLLAKARPVVILEVGNFERHGYSAQDVQGFFKKQQYCSFAMTDCNALSETDASMDHPSAMSVNRVLLPEEKLDSIGSSIDISRLTISRACV